MNSASVVLPKNSTVIDARVRISANNLTLVPLIVISSSVLSDTIRRLSTI